MRISWGQPGTRRFETGVDHGVLYLRDNAGAYATGVPWQGLTTVTQSPSGAESNKQYADNSVYLNLKSAEQFGATIEAFTYPDEFEQCDGTAEPEPGVYIGQQSRKTFGFSYRTLIGNDLESTDAGYKIHLVYGADANPSERAYGSVNESPEATGLSWDVTTTPTEVGTINGVEYKPTAHLTVDSTKVDAAALAALEDTLYGTEGADPRLPLPGEVFAMFSGTLTEVQTTAPTYNAATDIVTIPATAGVVYSVDGNDVPAGPFGPITDDTVVVARPAPGYQFDDASDTDWTIRFS
jgi:hypothetical protein